MKIIQSLGTTSLFMFLLFTLSLSVLVPAKAELGITSVQHPPIKAKKSSKKLQRLKQKRERIRSIKRRNKLSAKIDKIEQEQDREERIIALIAGILALVVGTLSLVLTGTAQIIFLLVLVGIVVLFLLAWGIWALINR
jgi:Flp pilus assembly protein TadB